MNQNFNQKTIGTREWYDFIGQMANLLSGLHLGGTNATTDLIKMCQLDSHSRVLDAGCGSGYTACLIAREYGSRVVGVDLSEIMINQAIERARKQDLVDKVEFRVGDLFQLPFEDQIFDLVIAESVLTPLPGDKKKALNEFVRVLKPGGKVAVNESTVDPTAPPEFLDLVAEHPAIHGHFTPHALRELFMEAGLQLVEMTEIKTSDAPGGLKDLGLLNLLSFMIRVYPRILLKLLRDKRFREASKIDDKITKGGQDYMSYCLIVGQK